MASVTLTAFLRTEEKSASVATIGKRRVKILSRLVATLADFLRKSKLVSV
jgi:hypothetical protein